MGKGALAPCPPFFLPIAMKIQLVGTLRFAHPASALPTLLIEIATIMARGLAGQPMKCGGERARLAEADIERNRGDGQLTVRQ
jgi:hypothetical protein